MRLPIHRVPRAESVLLHFAGIQMTPLLLPSRNDELLNAQKTCSQLLLDSLQLAKNETNQSIMSKPCNLFVNIQWQQQEM